MRAESLLCIPGTMLDESLFDHQRRHFESTLPVVTALPTHGCSIREMAVEILAKAPRRFALAGVSMGGIVAFEIWRQAPDRVTHLAFLSTTPKPDHPQRRAIRDEQVARARSGKLRDVLIQSMKPLYLGRRRRSDAALLDRILNMGLTLGADVFSRQSAALQTRLDSTNTLGEIHCPSLVLCGDEDSICPLETHLEMWRSLPRADLVVLSECGHLPTLEQPDAVTRHLENLLERT